MSCPNTLEVTKFMRALDRSKHISPLQLLVRALQRLKPLTARAGQPLRQALITLGLAHSFAQGLRRTANLRRNRIQRRPLGVVVRLVLEHQPHRPIPDFRGIPRRLAGPTSLLDFVLSWFTSVVYCTRVAGCLWLAGSINEM